MNKNYILLTPARNEEEKLPLLINSISTQTILPEKWLIVNDRSEDRTLEILKKACDKFDWIEYITLMDDKYSCSSKRYGYVCKKGFSKLFEVCSNEDLAYNFLGLSDADMVFPSNYFESLVNFLNNNDQVGLTGGGLKIKNEEGEEYFESNLQNLITGIRGTGILWRKKAFKDSGGFGAVKSPDAVNKIFLREEGWEIEKVDNLIYWQVRETGGKKSIKDGYLSRGRRAYYLHANIFSLLAGALSNIFHEKKPIVKTSFYLIGYFKAFVNRDEKINNKIVKKHNGSYKRFVKRILMRIENDP